MVAIVSRAAWGARTSLPANFVEPAARRFFVLHWPVMGGRDERQWMRDIENIHRNNGWSTAPGYSYCVGGSGVIYEGAGLRVRPIHSPPRNADSWAVCLLQPSTPAGVPTAALPPAMLTATRALYSWLSAQAGRPLVQWWHGRDFATACPGPDIRGWVQAGMPAQGGPASSEGEGNMIASTSTGRGYWTASFDGAVYAFGDAQFRGNVHARLAPGTRIVGITGVGTDGYWMLGSDGGVFSFGSAQFLGRPDRV